VLLADDHVVVAEAFASMLKDRFDIVGVVHDGRALLEAVEKQRPDVVITDISMPNLNGLDAIRQIRARLPGAKVIVLTMHDEGHLAADAFRAGALGYVLKVSPAEELVKAIGEVAQGRAYLTTLVAKDLIALLMEPPPKTEKGVTLTERQREVLQLVAEGRTMKEVATILGISPRTAESHKYEIMRLLGAKTTAELIQYALRTKSI
jgi:DNA-binding NarL/FixJ family response regulator